jgi:colanic acid/amylovoran biosynthesis protein
VILPSHHLFPRILQTGTYSSWNKGDAAMQIGTALAIRRQWPNADVVISAPFQRQDEPFYGGIARVVPCLRRRLVFASFQVIRAGLWRLVRDLAGIAPDWLIPDAELRATREADLVIDLSGDMLTDDYGPHVAWSHYIPIINALLLDRPVYICAQSIGPFRWTGWIARRIFRRAAAITVRDEISLRHLEEIGLDDARVELTADMAFLLEPALPYRVDEILAAENICFEGRPVLGVSLSRILEGRYIAENSGAAKSFVKLFADVLDRFAAEKGVAVLFVPHVTGPTPEKNDRNIATEVAAAMRTPAHVIHGDYRPEELKGLITRCSLFLGARMHANIAALSSGVPVVALSYSHKTPGIMALFGQSGYVVDGGEITGVLLQGKIDDAWAGRDHAAATISRAFSDLRERALRNLDIAAALMSERPQPG